MRHLYAQTNNLKATLTAKRRCPAHLTGAVFPDVGGERTGEGDL